MSERAFLEKFRGTPEGQRLLKTIRFAEGTSGPKGYQTMFGGGTFNDLSRHPDRVVHGNGYSSAAAGAYQFLPGTWQEQSSRLGLKKFGPEEQDIAALALARKRLMNVGGLATVSKEGLSQRVAAALSPEWASFPTESGRSYYGQPVKSLSELQKYYGAAPVSELQKYYGAAPVLAPASQTTTPSPASVSSPPVSNPPPVSTILSGLGLISPKTEEKKDFANNFAQGAIRQMIKNLLPTIFGTVQ
jgi:muramidase (phage lysozyme)